MASERSPALDAREVERRILEFIRGELVSPGVSVDRDDDLLADLLDSVAVLRLAAFVDEDFQIVTRPADFVIENFQTVAVLGAHVCRTAGRAGRPASDPEG